MDVDKSIITPKIDVDDKIIGNPSGGERQGVTFYTFWAGKKCNSTMSISDDGNFEELEAKNIKKHSGACFANLRHMFSKEKYNTLFYRVDRIHKSVIDKMPVWLEILSKEKIIPEYCGKNTFKSGTIILDISEMTIPTIYIRLCMLRYLREYPRIVIGSLYLMELGLDFFSAIVFCASRLIWSTGHSFIPPMYSYGQPISSCNEALTDARLVWATRELVINGPKYSKYYFGNPWAGFKAIETIDEISKKLPLLDVTLAELLRSDLVEALRSPDEEYVCKFFNEYRKQRNAK